MDSKKPIRTVPKMAPPRPGFNWRKLGVALLAFAAAAGILWAGKFYQTHAMPAVSLASTPVALKTLPQLREVADEKVRKFNVVFSSGNKTITPPLKQIGVTIDRGATAEAAFAARRFSDMPGSMAVWQAENVPLKISVDKQKLEKYIAAEFPEIYEAPEEPNLRYNPAAGAFEVMPGKNGRGFNIEKIAEMITEKAGNPGKIMITASNKPVEPKVDEAAALETLAATEQQLLVRLELVYHEKLIYYPEPAEIAGWLEFVPKDNGELAIAYDRAAMGEFIRSNVTASLNQFFGPGTDQPHSSEVPLRIRGVDALVADMVYALRSSESFVKEVEAMPAGENETAE